MSSTPVGIKEASRTFVFATDCTKHTRVKVNSSGQAAIAGRGEASIGTHIGYEADVSELEYGTVELDHQVGTKWYRASGAIAAGALVYPDADGEVTATPYGHPLAIALSSATADQDLIEAVPLARLGAAQAVVYTVGATEDTANQVVYNTGLGSLLVHAIATVRTSAGLERASTTTTISSGSVTVANSALAAGDVITIQLFTAVVAVTGS